MNESLNDFVRKRIFEQRRAQGMSQLALGVRCDTTNQYISNVERGVSNLTLNTVGKIAKALECDVSALLPPPAGYMELYEAYLELSPCQRELFLNLAKEMGSK